MKTLWSVYPSVETSWVSKPGKIPWVDGQWICAVWDDEWYDAVDCELSRIFLTSVEEGRGQSICPRTPTPDPGIDQRRTIDGNGTAMMRCPDTHCSCDIDGMEDTQVQVVALTWKVGGSDDEIEICSRVLCMECAPKQSARPRVCLWDVEKAILNDVDDEAVGSCVGFWASRLPSCQDA